MALRDYRVKILVHDPERQLGQAAEDLGATLLDGTSVDEVANVVIALSVAGPEFLVRVMHATVFGPTSSASFKLLFNTIFLCCLGSVGDPREPRGGDTGMVDQLQGPEPEGRRQSRPPLSPHNFHANR